MLHLVSVDAQCSIAIIINFIYSHVIRHKHLAWFFASGFVNVNLLQETCVLVAKEKYAYFLLESYTTFSRHHYFSLNFSKIKKKKQKKQ